MEGTINNRMVCADGIIGMFASVTVFPVVYTFFSKLQGTFLV